MYKMALQSSNVDKSWEPKIPPSLVKTPVTKKKESNKNRNGRETQCSCPQIRTGHSGPFHEPQIDAHMDT